MLLLTHEELAAPYMTYRLVVVTDTIVTAPYMTFNPPPARTYLVLSRGEHIDVDLENNVGVATNGM